MGKEEEYFEELKGKCDELANKQKVNEKNFDNIRSDINYLKDESKASKDISKLINEAIKKHTNDDVIILNNFYLRIKDIEAEIQHIKEQSQGFVKELKHTYVINLKTPYMLVVFITICLFFAGSLFGNINQYQLNRTLSDNDLKYRMIRKNGGCSTKDIQWLDTVFNIKRNEKRIKAIRHDIKKWENNMSE